MTPGFVRRMAFRGRLPFFLSYRNNLSGARVGRGGGRKAESYEHLVGLQPFCEDGEWLGLYSTE